MLQRLDLLLIFFAAVCASSALASTVTLVKDSKLVLTLESGENYQKDQKVKVMNAKNQTVALATVTLVKGNKAVATLEKGKAKVGLKADLTNASKAAASSGGSPVASAGNVDGKVSKKPVAIGKRYVGFVGGVVMDSAEVSFTPENGGAKDKVSLNGMAFSAKGLYEIPLARSYSLRLLSGLEQFNASGPNKASCGGKCEIKINYVAFDGWARFLLAQSGYKPWAGVGLGILYPLSKTSTTLDSDSIKPTSIFSFGGGIDYQLSNRSQIPIQIEYGFLPSSADVKASALAVRVGYSFVY